MYRRQSAIITGKPLPRALIASPHELDSDPGATATRLKLVAATAGLDAITMPDLLIRAGHDDAATARNFARCWGEAIADCQIVIADLSAFRGAEMAADTVFAIASMAARGGVVAGWSDDARDYAARVDDTSGPLTRDSDHQLRDADGHLVHEHGWPGNRLAIAAILDSAGEISASFEAACARAALVHQMQTAPDLSAPQMTEQPAQPRASASQGLRARLLARLRARTRRRAPA